MGRSPRILAVLAPLLVAGLGCRGPTAPTQEQAAAAAPGAPAVTRDASPALNASSAVRHDFEADELGAAPRGFTPGATIGAASPSSTNTPQVLVAHPARWVVAEDERAPSGRRCVRLSENPNTDEVFQLLVRDEPAPADVAVAAWLRADGGTEDRGGGIAWRLKDERNYYLARWNPFEKNLRFYRVESSRRIQLASVPIEANASTWHRLAVTMRGRVVDVAFDGRSVLRGADPKFTEPGKVAFWARSNATSSFDDLEVAPAPPR